MRLTNLIGSAFDQAIVLVIDPGLKHVSRRFLLADDNETKLVHLAHLLNAVGDAVMGLRAAREAADRKQGHTNLQLALMHLAAFSLLWMTIGKPTLNAGVKAIHNERLRQRELLRAGRIAFACESPITDNRRKFRVLFEECGEVAHALDQIENHGMAKGNLNLELSHVAAVAVAWLEAVVIEGRDGAPSPSAAARNGVRALPTEGANP